ncbi:MAG TPA: glycosyltransferase family 39 protein [Thermoanaerobaculia bacterium]|nr:glycosyltransferase family 39 protein [Thermoanaerobaculia bacterium]
MRFFLPLWTLLAAVALLLDLGGYPLLDADEGRNGEVAREMAATNDYVMPRIDGMPYLDKPIVYFAAEAAAMEVLGPTETAARLPAWLFTMATAALVGWFARRVWGGDAGWIAAIALMSMPLTLAFARTVIFDSALTFFIVLSIISFYLAVEGVILSREDGEGSVSSGAAPKRYGFFAVFAAQNDTRWRVLAWAAMALGVLTKGPVALAIPLFIAIPYAVWRKRFKALWSLTGLAVFALIIAPWVWAVSQVVPDFLKYVLVTETAERMATKALKRTGPPWYFIPYLIGGALPWALALFREKRRERDNITVFLMLWILIPFVFFSLSQSKRPQYILPLMPAVALLVARMWRTERREPGARTAGIALAILGGLLLVAPFFFHRTKMKPEVASVADETAYALGACLLVGGGVAVAFTKRRELTIAALSLPILAIPVATNALMDGLASRRSTASLIGKLKVGPRTEVVGVEAYTGSMQFYLRRPIIVATDDASEFTSNYILRHYDRFARDEGAPVRPTAWLRATLDKPDRLYIVRNDDRPNRALLESRGMRLLGEGAHFVAYEPHRMAR